jgi:hypothetical protein
MASEMRRAAQALVERRAQAFRSDYPTHEAMERLRTFAAAGKLGDFDVQASEERLALRSQKTGDETFVGRWTADAGGVTLAGEFLPASRTQRDLRAFAVALTVLVVASAWAFLSGQDLGTRASLACFTLLALLAFPYVILGLSSQRSAREAQLERSVRRALTRQPA